jgi:hypothetical protein
MIHTHYLLLCSRSTQVGNRHNLVVPSLQSPFPRGNQDTSTNQRYFGTDLDHTQCRTIARHRRCSGQRHKERIEAQTLWQRMLRFGKDHKCWYQERTQNDRRGSADTQLRPWCSCSNLPNTVCTGFVVVQVEMNRPGKSNSPWRRATKMCLPHTLNSLAYLFDLKKCLARRQYSFFWPGSGCAVPRAHATQLVCPATDWTVPGEQSVQFEDVFKEKEPGGHGKHKVEPSLL